MHPPCYRVPRIAQTNILVLVIRQEKQGLLKILHMVPRYVDLLLFCFSQYNGTERKLQDPNQNKLNRWIARSKGQQTISPIEEHDISIEEPSGKLNRWLARASGASAPIVEKEIASMDSGKLSRWLDRAKQRSSEEGHETSKLNRWLCRAKTTSVTSSPLPDLGTARGPSHDWSNVPSMEWSFEEEIENLTKRIRDSWAVIDAALAVRANAQQESEGSEETEEGSDSHVQTTNGLKCPSCGVELSATTGESLPAITTEAGARDAGGFRGLGLRVEEARKGLAVTHVVPDGLADSAGIQVCNGV